MDHRDVVAAVGQARVPGAEIYLRLLAETELRRALASPRCEPHQAGRAPGPVPRAVADGMERIRAAARALTAAGTIGEPAADSVLTGLTSALAVRSRVPLWLLAALPSAQRSLRRPPTPALLAGPVRIVPVSRCLPGGRDGELLHLLTLLVAPDRPAALTIAGQIPQDRRPPLQSLPAGPYGPYSLPDLGLTFADDHGTRYEGEIAGGGTCDGTWWCLEFFFSLPFPAGARWLDITAADGSAMVRVELPAIAPTTGWDSVAVAPAGAAEAASGVSALPSASAGPPGERLLDSIGRSLLWSALRNGGGGPQPSALTAMAAALEASGAAPPGSPALDRYTALSQQVDARGEVRADAVRTDLPGLPGAWNDVLANRGCRDGREEVLPVAAVLPEMDGARFALTGLYCSAESATLRAVSWGWQPPDDEPLLPATFSWWALDSTGRWHVAQQIWHGVQRNSVVLDITLVPPLHPAATSMEIILTGSSRRATVVVPLPAARGGRRLW